METDEIWKEVHDNDRYLISNKGRCKSKINNIFLKPTWNIRQVCIRNRNNPFGKHTYRGIIYKFEKDVIQN